MTSVIAFNREEFRVRVLKVVLEARFRLTASACDFASNSSVSQCCASANASSY